jgi:hypothetical protein
VSLRFSPRATASGWQDQRGDRTHVATCSPLRWRRWRRPRRRSPHRHHRPARTCIWWPRDRCSRPGWRLVTVPEMGHDLAPPALGPRPPRDHRSRRGRRGPPGQKRPLTGLIRPPRVPTACRHGRVASASAGARAVAGLSHVARASWPRQRGRWGLLHCRDPPRTDWMRGRQRCSSDGHGELVEADRDAPLDGFVDGELVVAAA